MTEIKRIIVSRRLNPTALQELVHELNDAIPEWEITYWKPTGNNDNPDITLERKEEE